MLHGKDLQIACEDALYKAEELLKIGWTKTWAINSKGQNCEPQDEDACAWCLEGALMAATYHQHPDAAERKQVIEACLVLIQTGNKEFHPYLKNNRAQGGGTAGSQISKWSVVPRLNDSIAKSKEEVVKWCHTARRLAKLAGWN